MPELVYVFYFVLDKLYVLLPTQLRGPTPSPAAGGLQPCYVVYYDVSPPLPKQISKSDNTLVKNVSTQRFSG